MVKLSILVALLGALLVVASATRWDPDRGSRGSRWDAPSRGDDQCQRQLQRANLRPCEEHIRQRVEQEQEQEQDEYPYIQRGSRGQRPGESDEDQEQRCCNELNRFQNNQRCMCQALQQILQNQSFRFQQDRSQLHQMERELRNLPQNCGFRSPSRCDLSSRTPY
ncbi:hypothetical protein HN51_019720 [Arachis hypogaea]|uniref:Bifunctional inhibitor/plant lipid transfer protein/seed storage helical domain-containing protein n=1 Tax=Arachis hypogaea TaxID=3818 RepID=A0A445BXW2_ARAHY|nr:Conglutin [Arachis hypogaea]RYR43594.1 hypothetical protein Ahy_A08g040016 [Arachis hypogaea]